MPYQRSAGWCSVDEQALQRVILAKIGHDLLAHIETPQELPEELLALVMQIEGRRSEDELAAAAG